MISYEEALDRIRRAVVPLGRETVEMAWACGRVLGAPLSAQVDSPAFDNSAMDGFAVRSADLADASKEHPVNLPVVGVVGAGDPVSGLSLAARETARVFTGGQIPPGADAVVMQEHVTVAGDYAAFPQSAAKGENVRRRGEEYKAGQELLSSGVRLNPAAVALAAANGLSRLTAYRKPKIGVVATGNELMQPGAPLSEGCIYESNSYGIAAALSSLGFEAPLVHRVPDDEAATMAAFEAVLSNVDVAISSGGVSVGEFDAVRTVMPRLGIREVFWGVAVKPGKPVYCGVRDDGKVVLGLPGNPLSALVTLMMLGIPALSVMEGLADPLPRASRATLGEAIKKKPGRLEFVPANLDENGVAWPAAKRASHMLGAMAQCDCLIHFPAEAERLEVLASVKVTPLTWGLG